MAIGRYHSILLEKGASSWVIKYDLFGSAYTTLPAEAPLVKIEGSYGGDYFLSVSGFPSFKEILSVLPAKPQWYLEMMAVSYTHLRAHETRHDLVCRLLLEKK